MAFLTVGAIYFILWWMVLFIVLPLGHRSQDDEGEVTMGTVQSAPAQFRGLRVVILTTVISAAIYLVFHYGLQWLGLGMDDIPQIVPKFH